MSKLDSLLKYHEAELRLDALESKVLSSPAHKKLNKLHGFLTEQQSQITAIQKQLDARKSAIDKLTTQFDELSKKYELEVSEFAIMENDEECTAAEMTESRKAIEALLDKLENARRDLFDTLNYIEKATAEYKDTYAKAGKAKKEYDTARAECDEEVKLATPELDAAKAEHQKLRQDVDEALLQKYANVKSHHAVPMAKVADNQCGGCNMSLPTSVVKRVASGIEIVECENCGRILYT
ncbi:MAG: C4-type zinc ribbon domain-containing protein [Clostridia bacterium]